MIQGISSALSALQVLGEKINTTANNVANANTPGYKNSSAYAIPSSSDTGNAGGAALSEISGNPLISAEPPAEESNVDIVEELTNLKLYQRSFEANLKVLETENEMKGDVINLKS